MLSFPSCHGILGDIYDEPSEESKLTYGFIETNPATHSGKIYIDVSSYTQWIYMNFEDQDIYINDIDKETGKLIGEEPKEWDFAMHRYDGKTRGGAIMETSFSSLDELVHSGKLPEGEFVSDILGKITVDMSNMMDGIIIYSESFINMEFAKWLDVNTNQMPPIYTLSKKVYILRTKEGKYAALYLPNFRNAASDSGFITIEYVYPLEF